MTKAPRYLRIRITPQQWETLKECAAFMRDQSPGWTVYDEARSCLAAGIGDAEEAMSDARQREEK